MKKVQYFEYFFFGQQSGTMEKYGQEVKKRVKQVGAGGGKCQL